jgi:putative heme iron utilization protein
LSVATAAAAVDLNTMLKEQPDGALDDIARLWGVPMRLLDPLPEAAARDVALAPSDTCTRLNLLG